MHLLGQFQPISNRACSFHQAKSGPANLHKDPELSHIESDWKPDASARADSVAASCSQDSAMPIKLSGGTIFELSKAPGPTGLDDFVRCYLTFSNI